MTLNSAFIVAIELPIQRSLHRSFVLVVAVPMESTWLSAGFDKTARLGVCDGCLDGGILCGTLEV